MKTVLTLTLNTHRNEPIDAQAVRKASPGGGWDTREQRRTLLEQHIEDIVEVVIDVDAIALLIARRAADASNGRSSTCRGLVRARRTKRRSSPPDDWGYPCNQATKPYHTSVLPTTYERISAMTTDLDESEAKQKARYEYAAAMRSPAAARPPVDPPPEGKTDLDGLIEDLDSAKALRDQLPRSETTGIRFHPKMSIASAGRIAARTGQKLVIAWRSGVLHVTTEPL